MSPLVTRAVAAQGSDGTSVLFDLGDAQYGGSAAAFVARMQAADLDLPVVYGCFPTAADRTPESRVAPAGLSRMLRPTRSKSGWPMSSSSRPIIRLTADGLTPSSPAARLTCSCSATARKVGNQSQRLNSRSARFMALLTSFEQHLSTLNTAATMKTVPSLARRDMMTSLDAALSG